MSWHFKSIARTSALSQAPFTDGERVVCLVYKDTEKGEIIRADMRSEEVEQFEPPGELLGRWVRVVKDPEDAQDPVREKLTSAEDFFFSLYEMDQANSQKETDALKHLLALMLERKRVVRAQGKRQHAGAQTYLHVKTRQMLNVPIVAISADLMESIQQTIGDIIL